VKGKNRWPRQRQAKTFFDILSHGWERRSVFSGCGPMERKKHILISPNEFSVSLC